MHSGNNIRFVKEQTLHGTEPCIFEIKIYTGQGLAFLNADL